MGTRWFVDGIRTNSFQGGVQAGKRFERPDQLGHADHWVRVSLGHLIFTGSSSATRDCAWGRWNTS